MNIKHILIPALLFFYFAATGTHNRAGEITYEQIGDLTIRATITTYTKTSSVPADRDTLQLFWGDGTFTMVPRSNGNGSPLPNDIKVNYYIATHTYPGRAGYTLSMMDPNRVGGIINVNPPNSDGVPFYLETSFTFLNTQFQGFNSSPVLLQPPLDYACVGKRYIHNPNAFDPDGDSLSYELIIPLQDSGVTVPNYIFPDQIGPGPDNLVSLNPVTGDYVWNAPQVAGTYNIAFRIHEYRGGVRINSMIRDMQILVLQCDNSPPVIESEDEFCVIAGETLEFDILVTDPDSNQKVSLTALGGPFEVSDKVSISVGSGFMDPPFTATFRWETVCNEISAQYYTVVFKATDNFFGGSDTTGLADLKTVRIKVVGPPPLDPEAFTTNDRIKISWQSPYACEVTDEEYFRGFSVWRRAGSNAFPLDTCNPGLNGKSYTQIGFDVNDLENQRYVFEDVDVESGKTYCYRILAEFALLTPSGNPFNRVASLTSDEVCIQLNRDIPLLIEASVIETDETSGIMNVSWVKPLANALDTIQNPGPYRFELFRSSGIGTNDFTLVPNGTFESPTFLGLTDTMVVNVDIDTRSSAHTYQVLFYTDDGNRLFDNSPAASSVFLTGKPTDNAALLSWDYETPWSNYAFEIYRSDDFIGPYVLIGTTTDFEYRDGGLQNGEDYCYYLRAIGSYGISTLPEPLFNNSQISCLIPEDDVPACPPIANVSNICDRATDDTPEDAFKNTVTWQDDFCVNEEIFEYRIYYTPVQGGTFELIGVVSQSEPHLFIHEPLMGIAGCYAVTNVDLNGNESDFSTVVCVDNCPFYELPNAFTPNGDGANDLFIPFPYRFVDRIELTIFNRWGQVVYKTTDPDIRWDGMGLNGKELSDGVYHYVCTVFEQASASGNQNVQLLKGYIELIRGSR